MCICSAQFGNLRNLEIALRNFKIPKLRGPLRNFKLHNETCAILKLRKSHCAILELCNLWTAVKTIM